LIGLLDRRRANKGRICLGLCSRVEAGAHWVALVGFSRRVDGRLGKIHIAEKIYRVYGLILQIKYLKKSKIRYLYTAMLLYNNRSNFSFLIESIKSEALKGLVLFLIQSITLIIFSQTRNLSRIFSFFFERFTSLLLGKNSLF